MQNSGEEVAIVIKVADANSCFILSSKKTQKKYMCMALLFWDVQINSRTLTEDVNGSDKIFVTNDGQHPKTIAHEHHVHNNLSIFLYILLIVRKIKEGSMSPHVIEIFLFRQRFIFHAHATCHLLAAAEI